MAIRLKDIWLIFDGRKNLTDAVNIFKSSYIQSFRLG